VIDSDNSGPYLRGDVELLPDTDEPGAEADAEATLATFERYRTFLSELRGGPVLAGEMPSDPAYLSYALASTCLLTLPQRQQLLEAETAVDRLARLRRTLHDEIRAMRALPSLPATEVARTRWSPN
jgi:Lon protease-like protein